MILKFVFNEKFMKFIILSRDSYRLVALSPDLSPVALGVSILLGGGRFFTLLFSESWRCCSLKSTTGKKFVDNSSVENTFEIDFL